jgi:hypothetical protein
LKNGALGASLTTDFIERVTLNASPEFLTDCRGRANNYEAHGSTFIVIKLHPVADAAIAIAPSRNRSPFNLIRPHCHPKYDEQLKRISITRQRIPATVPALDFKSIPAEIPLPFEASSKRCFLLKLANRDPSNCFLFDVYQSSHSAAFPRCGRFKAALPLSQTARIACRIPL